jgi:hypothetical protein
MPKLCKSCGQKLPFPKQDGRFVKTIYQRDYMRARRAREKAEKNRIKAISTKGDVNV